MMMPGMRGYEVEAELRKIDPDLCILFISGYSRDVLDREHSHAPTKPFLAKPFTPEMLARKVRDLLDSRQPLELQTTTGSFR